MANPEHHKILKQGVEEWNKWRIEHPEVRADLSKSDLYGTYLSEANLTGANLSRADLSKADLSWADLSKANLVGAKLWEADLSEADLSEADLSEANLLGANLSEANLSEANLSGANLMLATLVETDVTDATITGCQVYGISVWNLQGEPQEQNNLLISRDYYPIYEPAITVDNLEVAQFIYMLIKYEKLRDVIHTIANKVVLILGRFTEERLAVLKALQEELRQYKDKDGKARYIPVMFDFDPLCISRNGDERETHDSSDDLKQASQDLLDTVQTIAGMSRFIIADITSPTGVLVELASIIPTWNVPIKLLLDTSTRQQPVAMSRRFALYRWLVRSPSGEAIFGYGNSRELCESIEELISPIEHMVGEIRKAKAQEELGIENRGGGNV